MSTLSTYAVLRPGRCRDRIARCQPAPEIESVAVSPDGATLAVVAGGKVERYPPSDLFTIRLLDDAAERWTHDGSVVDAASVDGHTVIFVGEANGFDVLDLNTRSTRRIAAPEGLDT